MDTYQAKFWWGVSWLKPVSKKIILAQSIGLPGISFDYQVKSYGTFENSQFWSFGCLNGPYPNFTRPDPPTPKLMFGPSKG